MMASAVDSQDRVHGGVDDLGLLMPLHLGDALGRLEVTEQRVVATLGVEVVDDREHGLTPVGELAHQRLRLLAQAMLLGSIRPGLTDDTGPGLTMIAIVDVPPGR